MACIRLWVNEGGVGGFAAAIAGISCFFREGGFDEHRLAAEIGKGGAVAAAGALEGSGGCPVAEGRNGSGAGLGDSKGGFPVFVACGAGTDGEGDLQICCDSGKGYVGTGRDPI